MDKEERKAYNKKYYIEHKATADAYNKKYYQDHKGERVAYNKAYNALHKTEIIVYNKAHSKEYKARYIMNRAISRGMLIKPEVCSNCNQGGKIEGHHEDYDKPLEVTWLCVQCHNLHHVERRGMRHDG
jgi:hypothetical protein